MPSMQLQKSALKHLNISVETWNNLSSEDRKKRYHEKIIDAILKNHSDRHLSDIQVTKSHEIEDLNKFIDLGNLMDGLNALDYKQKFKENVAQDKVNDHDATEKHKDFDINRHQLFSIKPFQSQEREKEKEKLAQAADWEEKKPRSKTEFVWFCNFEARAQHRFNVLSASDPGTPYWDRYQEFYPGTLKAVISGENRSDWEEEPQSAKDFIWHLQSEAEDRDWFKALGTKDPGTPYFDKHKKLFPTLLKMKHYADLRCCYNGTEDFTWAREAIPIKESLKKYEGSEDFVVALVSRDKSCIKTTFETMVKNIVAIDPNLLAKDERVKAIVAIDPKFGAILQKERAKILIEQFIDYFCPDTSTPIANKDGFEITGTLRLDIFKMLSLKLPYAIIDLDGYKLDQKLVKMVFTNYVNSISILNEEIKSADQVVVKMNEEESCIETEDEIGRLSEDNPFYLTF